MEKVIRVLVANRPRLMRELILTTFADQPEHRNCWRSWRRVGDLREHKENPADFVVIALDHPGTRPAICDELLREHPEVRVIAVAPEKNFVVTTGFAQNSFERHRGV